MLLSYSMSLHNRAEPSLGRALTLSLSACFLLLVIPVQAATIFDEVMPLE